MLHAFKVFSNVSKQVGNLCETQPSFLMGTLLKIVKCDNSIVPKNFFHVHLPRMKDNVNIARRKEILRANKNNNTVVGENFINIDESLKSSMFPTVDLPNTLFDGVPFKEIPVVYVKATKNNTILSLFDRGVTRMTGSCGCEGFKNTRKSTSVAAQATGTSFGIKAIKKGYKLVRTVVKGFGAGRLSALKGLQIAGLNIVSITDNTIDETSLRPKKQRRI